MSIGSITFAICKTMAASQDLDGVPEPRIHPHFLREELGFQQQRSIEIVIIITNITPAPIDNSGTLFYCLPRRRLRPAAGLRLPPLFPELFGTLGYNLKVE